MTAATSPVDLECVALGAAFPGATARSLGDGSVLITLPQVALPEGWNQPVTAVYFAAPVNYPLANPDCFWADPGLRLSGGALPANTNLTPLPDPGGLATEPHLWFSWHVHSWTPGRDTLLSYARVIERRFQERR